MNQFNEASGRIKTGIEGFDGIINGGFFRPSFILLSGPPGTGKSSFAIQFLLNGIKKNGEKGMYVSFQENKEIFKRNIFESLGVDIGSLIDTKTFLYQDYFSSLKIDSDCYHFV